MLTLFALAVALYLALAGGLYVFQRRIQYVPDRTRPDLAEAGVPGLRAIETTTADGLRLLAWYLPPPLGRPVVVYFHGNAGHLGYRQARFGVWRDAGFGVLFVEYRGYGGNPGSPSEDGLFADARAALGFLRVHGIAPDRIVLYGESLGTGVAVRMATEHTIAALVLEAPFTSAADVAQRRYPWVPAKLLLKDKFDSAALIDRVRAPILVLLGERDTIVPAVLGRSLYGMAPEPKTLWVAPEGGHTDLRDHGALDVVTAFIRRHVKS